MQFAWKKRGGQQIALDVDYSQANDDFVPRNEQQRRMKELRELRGKLSGAEATFNAIQERLKDKPDAPNANVKNRFHGSGIAAHLRQLEQLIASYKAQIVQVESTVGRQEAGGALHLRYSAGPAIREDGVPTHRLSDRIPDQWTLVTKNDGKPLDLYADLNGGGDITGITLLCPDGEFAEIDHIYLGRTEADLANAPPPAPPIPGAH
jgi:hypothetical protein